MGSFMEEKWFQYKECLNRLRLFRLGVGREERGKKRQNAKIVKNPQQNNKLTEEKSTEKGHYKQVFNRWTKSAMTYQFKMVHMLYSKKLCCCSYLSHHILRAIKNPNKRISVLLSKS